MEFIVELSEWKVELSEWKKEGGKAEVVLGGDSTMNRKGPIRNAMIFLHGVNQDTSFAWHNKRLKVTIEVMED